MSVAFSNSGISHSVESMEADILTRIYEKDINLVNYIREPHPGVNTYATELIRNNPDFSFCEIMDMNSVENELDNSLPDYDEKETFVYDIFLLCDMYSILFGLVDIGVRLVVLDRAMCPRFHVDNVPCRLLTTYNQSGSEWLSEDNLDRSKLGRGNNGLPDNESGIYFKEEQIMRLQANSIALLKGESWPDNTGNGLVHRSPNVEKGKSRLLLSLDFV